MARYKLIENDQITNIAVFDDADLAASLGYTTAADDDTMPPKPTTIDDLRKMRDEYLATTDFWALSDMPEMTADQIAYRQALRDITVQYTNLEDVIWPSHPNHGETP